LVFGDLDVQFERAVEVCVPIASAFGAQHVALLNTGGHPNGAPVSTGAFALALAGRADAAKEPATLTGLAGRLRRQPAEPCTAAHGPATVAARAACLWLQYAVARARCACVRQFAPQLPG